mmetsp:Transcript_15793/g.63605  ORF Transcript_15793/g.63605 Transcript_15793/m.63605 type:complete len:250 (+) Transcript_15793:400-1149(+)
MEQQRTTEAAPTETPPRRKYTPYFLLSTMRTSATAPIAPHANDRRLDLVKTVRALGWSRYGGSQTLVFFASPGSFFCPQPANVTNSSAMVGWIATEASKSRRVAPIRTATAKPWSISSDIGPMQCSPTTVSSGPARTSLSPVLTLWSASLKAKSMLPKADCLTATLAAPNFATASGSVRPTVPMGGCEKTTVAMSAYSMRARGSPPKSRSPRRRPAAMATGVSSYPVVVASPMAYTFGSEVFSYSSTTT